MVRLYYLGSTLLITPFTPSVGVVDFWYFLLPVPPWPQREIFNCAVRTPMDDFVTSGIMIATRFYIPHAGKV